MRALLWSVIATLATAGISIIAAPTLPASAVTAPAPLHVAGNRLVDPLGRPVQLRGVNVSGPEYACIQGWGIFDGPSDQASIDAIKSWNVNAVRVPLNEDCWLAINDSPASYSGTTYQRAITSYVSLLNQSGLYAILELHFSAPGTELATGQQPMPDLDHSPAFWSAVASAFKGNDAVIFDLFNEPHPDTALDTAAGWLCWRDGGTCPGLPFQAAGMQTLVDAVRATGATNVIALSGIRYGNALSEWLAFKPTDPLNNLVAAWHVYNFNLCSNIACYDGMVGIVAAQMPVLATEIGNNACDAGFMNTLMSWLDARQTGYLAWAWGTGSACSDIGLIAGFDGTPTPYGQIFKTHLATFPPAIPADTVTTLTSTAVQSVFGQAVTFTARVATAPPGTWTPGGTVTFFDGSASLGTAAISGGEASFSISTLAVSSPPVSHSITASYGGAAGFTPSISNPLTHTVSRASTVTTITTNGPNPSVFAQPTAHTVTVAVAGPGAGTPRGTVTLHDGVTSVGARDLDASGQASFTFTDLAIGAHSLTATYHGTTDFEGGTSAAITHAVSCPETLTIPLAIVGEDGRVIAVGTIRGTEATTGSRCTVAYSLAFQALTVGGGTFLADYLTAGVIRISHGTFAFRGVTLPLSFAGTVNSDAGIATIAYTFASGAPGRTVTIHYTLGPTGEWIITSLRVTSS